MSLCGLNPRAPPFAPLPQPGRSHPEATPYLSAVDAARRRLLLAALLHPRLGLGTPAIATLREPALLATIAALLPVGRTPLAFTVASPTLDISAEDGALVRRQPSDRWGHYRTAICVQQAPMASGVHYAEFTLVNRGGWVKLGVVDAQFLAEHDPTGLGWSDSNPAVRPTDAELRSTSPTATAWGWGYNTALGSLSHNRREISWAGQQPAAVGDCIGLLCDFDDGSITLYKNAVTMGYLIHPGAGAEDLRGRRVYWMAELHDVRDAVRIVAMRHPLCRD